MNIFNKTKSELYSHLKIEGTGYLAYREIPRLIEKYVKSGNMSLDYGCGAGRSSAFLQDLKLYVDAVDVCPLMIDKAITNNPGLNIKFKTIKSGIIPSPNAFYDLVFSCLVMLEINSKNNLLKIFNEINRVLKKNGIFIMVTANTEMYNHDWLSVGTNFSQNNNLNSGDLAKIIIKNIGLELEDYYWTTTDYENLFRASKFQLIERLFPLGKKEDHFNWKNELLYAPYVVFVVEKL